MSAPEKTPVKNSVGNFFRFFFAAYPKRTVLAMSGLFVAGLFEGFGAAMLLSVLGILAGSVPGKFSLMLQNAFENAGVPFSLGSLLFIVTALLIAKGFISLLAMREVGKTAALVTASLRKRLIDALLGARWYYFTTLPSGRAASAIGAEAERASLAYLMMCVAISDAMLVVIYLCVALFVSWQASLAAVVCGTGLMFFMRGIIRQTRKAGKAQTEHLNRLLRQLFDSLNAIKPIKAMARDAHYAALINKDIDALEQAQEKQYFSRELLRLTREPILVVFLAAGLYAGVRFLHLELSALLVLAFLFLRIVMKIMNMQSSYQLMAQQDSAFWSLYGLIMESERAQEEAFGSKPPALDKAIGIDRVSFTHRRGDREGAASLRDLSFDFQAKRFHIISGPSGSGKTTLVDLMLGLYRPDAGTITLDGTALKDIDIRAWRERVGYVPQDCVLFHDTIMNNITLGDARITEDAAIQALKAADAWAFVKGLPRGLHESAGEKGQLFSGGQRQRLAIARAIVKNPLLLLLDEPTSALDKNSEKAIMETVRHLSETMTVIMISHSFRAEGADDVLVLDEGQLLPAKKIKAV